MTANIREIQPAKSFRGEVRLPGDKSISHRVALIGAISEGTTEGENFPASADCHSTLACLRALGVDLSLEHHRLRVAGRGLGGLQAPQEALDAGNSGTTVRLLSGILAGQPFSSTLSGDPSLCRRPMKRVIDPLRRFGAHIEAAEGEQLPLRIQGGPLQAIDCTLPVASAQVKSAILLAGLYASGVTSVRETFATRDHTEIALGECGANITSSDEGIDLEGGRKLRPRSIRIPGDISSAAFLVAAALALPDSELRLMEVGVNPTRSGYLSLLERIGGIVSFGLLRSESGEPVADVTVRSSTMGRIEVHPAAVPSLIDELPVLAVLGSRCRGGLRVRGAAELRLKESDRIAAIVGNLESVGVFVEEFPDGLSVDGPQAIEGGTVSSHGDHRIAMAFAVAGLLSKFGVRIQDPDCVDVSFPGFFDVLEELAQR